MEREREREPRALDEAMVELGIATSTIVTLGHAEDVAVSSGAVQVVPGWEWLLRR